MKKYSIIIILIIMMLLLIGCAKSNDPVQPGSNLKITQTFSTVGPPNNLAITNDYIIATQKETGFSVYNRKTGETIGWYNEFDFNGSIIHFKDSRNVDFFPEANAFIIYDYNYDSASGARFELFKIDNNEIIYGQKSITSNTNSIVGFNFHDDDDNSSSDSLAIVGNWIRRESGGNTYKGSLYKGFVKKDQPIVFNSYLFTEINLPSLNGRDVNYSISEDENYYYACGIYGIQGTKLTITSDGEYFNGEMEKTFEIDTPGEAMELCKNGNYIYVADRQSGLQVIDITDENSPKLLKDSSFDTSGHWRSISTNGQYLAAISGGTGLYVFSLQNPAKPKLVGNLPYKLIGYTNKVKFFNDRIYVASRDKGILEIEIKK